MSQLFDKFYIVPKLNKSFEENLRIERIILHIQYVASTTEIYTYKYLGPNSQHLIDSNTLVIAIGGDGTMLEAMKIASVKNAIVTGINLGKVGFLTDFSADGVMLDVNILFNSPTSYPIEDRMSLMLFSDDVQHTSRPVFNEYVFSSTYSDELIKYHLRINDVDAGFHRANGLIVGTPTGSTAYTLSNGGGLLYPSMNVMQIVPVAPLSLSSRPIIVPGDARVEITVEAEHEWRIKGDGNLVCGGAPWTFTVTQSLNPARILHAKTWNFFDMLSTKLHWKKS